MAKVTFISADGSSVDAEIDSGKSLMDGAIHSGIEGIVAECGGVCACATCHCYIDEAWSEKIGKIEALEADMLDMAVDPKVNSRLSCQIQVTEEMDGLVVHVPESQY